MLTDQTSAHDRAARLRARTACPSTEALRRCARSDPERYQRRVVPDDEASTSPADDRAPGPRRRHVRLRQQPARPRKAEAGLENAFDFEGFVPKYIRPLFCLRARGPSAGRRSVWRSGGHRGHRPHHPRSSSPRTMSRSCRWLRHGRRSAWPVPGFASSDLLARVRRACQGRARDQRGRQDAVRSRLRS